MKLPAMMNITKPMRIVGIGKPVVSMGGNGSAIILFARGISLEEPVWPFPGWGD